MQRKIKGILLIVVPIPLLMFVLAAYAIMSFVISSIIEASGDELGAAATIGSIISVLLSLLGIVAIIGILIGIPLGIYLIVTGDKHKVATVPPAAPLPPAQE